MEPLPLLPASTMLLFNGIAMAAYSISLMARKGKDEDPLISTLSMPSIILATINMVAVILILCYMVLEYPILKIVSFTCIFSSSFVLMVLLSALAISIHREERLEKEYFFD